MELGLPDQVVEPAPDAVQFAACPRIYHLVGVAFDVDFGQLYVHSVHLP